MEFEWDTGKAISNIRKHGVSFEDAVKIFEGFVVSKIDDRFDYGEERIKTIGKVGNAVILVVIHTDRSGKLRVISARQASEKEIKDYETEIYKAFDA